MTLDELQTKYRKRTTRFRENRVMSYDGLSCEENKMVMETEQRLRRAP